MSRVHYFQRYSQKENVATNNTLLLFSRLYNHSPARFEDFLNALSGDGNLTFDVGMQFAQQEGNTKRSSVPDGLITQKSIKVVIETKLHGDYGLSQLSNHLESFQNEDTQVLLLLDPRKPNDAFLSHVISDVKSFNQANDTQVICLATTFTEIIKNFDSVLLDYDLELNEILDDFREFCDSMSLLPRDEVVMRAIVTGYTFHENMEFGVYYDPIDRGFSNHTYLGLYKNKSVRGIGKLTKIVHAEYDKDTGEFNTVAYQKGSELTEDEQKRIIEVMRSAEEVHGWNVYTGHHFFVVDEFEPSNFNKSSKYPIQRSKYFDLGDVLDTEVLPSDSEIAARLTEKSWS
jgi:hypothetical protein